MVTAGRDVALIDVLDRVLEGGVTVQGDVILSAADIDLVKLDLRVLVSSVEKLTDALGARRPVVEADPGPAPAPRAQSLRPRHTLGVGTRARDGDDNVEKGLAQLVLTVIELLRQLMERQALHRIEGGRLSEVEIERLGGTFMALAERMNELREAFGLEDNDLNLNLGPLGDLL